MHGNGEVNLSIWYGKSNVFISNGWKHSVGCGIVGNFYVDQARTAIHSRRFLLWVSYARICLSIINLLLEPKWIFRSASSIIIFLLNLRSVLNVIDGQQRMEIDKYNADGFPWNVRQVQRQIDFWNALRRTYGVYVNRVLSKSDGSAPVQNVCARVKQIINLKLILRSILSCHAAYRVLIPTHRVPQYACALVQHQIIYTRAYFILSDIFRRILCHR